MQSPSAKDYSFLRDGVWEPLSFSYGAAQMAQRDLDHAASGKEPARGSGGGSASLHRVWAETAAYIAFDITAFFLVGAILVGLLGTCLPTRQLNFRCDDPALSVAFRENSVSVGALISSVILVPLAAILSWERCLFWRAGSPSRPLLAAERVRRFGAQVAGLMVEYMLGLLLVVVPMEVGKNGFGRLRPHFLSVCEPGPGCGSCTGAAKAVRVARQSFPSGHAAAAVYCAAWVGWYLLGAAPLRAHWGRRFWATVLLSAAALGTGASRVTDGWHFASDVAGGTVLGILAAVYVASRRHSLLYQPRMA